MIVHPELRRAARHARRRAARGHPSCRAPSPAPTVAPRPPCWPSPLADVARRAADRLPAPARGCAGLVAARALLGHRQRRTAAPRGRGASAVAAAGTKLP
ncbi:hypothetical protein SGRIM128S_01373 [Streptomyces griseomycini]